MIALFWFIVGALLALVFIAIGMTIRIGLKLREYRKLCEPAPLPRATVSGSGFLPPDTDRRGRDDAPRVTRNHRWKGRT